jgi:signal transduction histidine kinase
MNLRRLAIDAGIVALLAAATVAYVRRPGGGWLFFTDEKVIEKLGGHAVWEAAMVRWWAASAVGTGAMLMRSRLPVVALAGAAAMTLVHVTTSVIIPLLPLDAATPIALFSLAARPPSRRVSYAAFAVTLGLSFVPALWANRISGEGFGGGTLTPPTAVALAWLFGDRSRAQREQASRRARDLERERDQQAEIGAAAERARIARELHDAVAHGLSIIVIQAQAGGGALDQRPTSTRTAHDATARAALEAIETTGRDSLTEMRRLLGLDRPGEADPGAADLAPLPGATDLPALVARVAATGLPVKLQVTGDLTALPTGVGLSAYRIVQEALTNALKHAGPDATVQIDVCHHPEAVELTVADTGRGAGGPVDERRGNGLRGMRERVTVLGGSLSAGDIPAGGFRVHARLPLAVTS